MCDDHSATWHFYLIKLCTVRMAGEVPLLDYITPNFNRTDVSAHGVIFYRRQIVGWEGPDFLLDQKSVNTNWFSL